MTDNTSKSTSGGIRLTGISIENFKGIRERVDIELRPLTLLFGANSAGKSSILHALQYAAELLCSRNLDAGLIGEGAAGIDLGGFKNFVHGHDLTREVTLGFEASLQLDDASILSAMLILGKSLLDLDYHGFLYGVTTCNRMPRTLRVELTIGWNARAASVYIRKYALTLGGTQLAEIHFETSGSSRSLSVNALHPMFGEPTNVEDFGIARHNFKLCKDRELTPTMIQQLLDCNGKFREAYNGFRPGKGAYTSLFESECHKDALPLADHDELMVPNWEWIYGGEDQWRLDTIGDVVSWLPNVISFVMLAPLALLRRHLTEARFLGPVREIPQRNHNPTGQRGRWSTGQGAWDRLQSADSEFIDSVNHWLGAKDRLDAGYRIWLKRFREVEVRVGGNQAANSATTESDLDIAHLPIQTRLLIVPTDGSVELRLNDVGVGLSQVVPVIVTALDGARRTVSIEQPELHLHPKLQAELGDLFIEAAKGKSQNLVILETHSELITLRLMRRIKENAEKSGKEKNDGLTSEDVAIHYVETFQGATIVTQLNLGERGQLLDPWPKGFFEEGFRERFSE